jgi:hypothetical protein
MPRLAATDAHCAPLLAGPGPYSLLAEESLRGYVALLSSHFQGFARDLSAECAQVVASKVRPSLRILIQTQFSNALKLDHGNPTLDNIAGDFDRFGFDFLAAAKPHPAFAGRREHLRQMNKWRNAVAHRGPAPHGVPPLTLALVRDWRTSCDGLATHLTDIMYNQLKRVLRRAPW